LSMNPRKLSGCVWGALVLTGLTSCREKAPDEAAPAVTQAALPAAAPAASGVDADALSAPGASDPLCVKMCERGSALHCKVDVSACRDACQHSLSPPCDSELRASLTCVTAEPIAHWECSDEGLPVIRDGYCNAEQAKLMACVQRTLGDSAH
jgi:hypothetical protein